MSRPRFQFTIGQIMVAVAILAAAMAFVGPRIAPAALTILIVPRAIFVAVRRRWGGDRDRIVAWLLVAYPLALLAAHYCSWALVFGMLGHRPGSAAGDRRLMLGFPVVDLELIAALLMIASIPAAWLCIGFVLAEVVRSTRTDAAGPSPAVLVMSAIASWFFLFLFVTTDPGRTFAWFWD